MNKNLKAFGLSLVVLMSLSACGRGTAKKDVTVDPLTATDTKVQSANATCKNMSPVGEIPKHGWVEIQPEALKTANASFRLENIYLNTVVVKADGKTVSASTSTQMGDVNAPNKGINMNITCQDLAAADLDKLPLVMRAAAPEFFQSQDGLVSNKVQVMHSFGASNKDSRESLEAKRVSATRTFYQELDGVKAAQEKAREQGNEVEVRLYASPSGDEIELRASENVMMKSQDRRITSTAMRFKRE